MEARKVLVILSISGLSSSDDSLEEAIFANRSLRVLTFPAMTVSRRRESASPSSVPTKC
jgi:hypothetical protein